MSINIYSEIQAERERQDAKWGQQNHPLFTWMAILGEEVGEANKGSLDVIFGMKPTDNYREELIQVAAVAVAAVESLDRGNIRG